MTGTLDPASVTNENVMFFVGTKPVPVAGAATLGADGKTLSFVPTMRLAYGQTYYFAATVKDTLGRTVQMNITFTTSAMVCVDTTIWSNPATFSAEYQDCVADIGVQTLVNASYNTLQDDSCAITIGTPLSAACKAYMANGTMILAKTSVVVNGHASIFMTYTGTDTKSNIVLLDANDPNNLVPVGAMSLPNPLVWITGNSTDASISMSTSVAGVFKNEQVTWNSTKAALVILDPIPTPTPTPAPTLPPCPTGEAQIASKICPDVLPASTTVAQDAVVSPHSFKGVAVTMTGTLDPASVTNETVTLSSGTKPVPVGGAVSLSADGKTLSFVPTMRLAYGQTYYFATTMKDTLGRQVGISITFTTSAMSCVDNTIWSDPATFSATYQDCVAGIGTQTLVNPNFNTLQDNSCVITVGTPLTSSCKAYMSNGTMVLSNTSVVVNGHASIFMVYGTDAKNNNIVLLDANDPNNLVPVGMIALPNPFVWMWIIGYPTGASISLSTNTAGVFKSEQVTWSASTSTLVEKCTKNC
jgi:hypothetical protein